MLIDPLPIGLCAQAACIAEVTARKPGNVHRHCDFDDVGYVDFLLSAAAVAPALDAAHRNGVGPGRCDNGGSRQFGV